MTLFYFLKKSFVLRLLINIFPSSIAFYVKKNHVILEVTFFFSKNFGSNSKKSYQACVNILIHLSQKNNLIR
jgi:hypothetical protein